MNIKKAEYLVVKDREGKILHNIAIGSIAYIEHQLHGKVLTIQQKK